MITKRNKFLVIESMLTKTNPIHGWFILSVIQIIDSVYEPIYTVKNQYNDFIILQDGFLCECSCIVEEAVYINNIHDKTVQWESPKQSCSIIKAM